MGVDNFGAHHYRRNWDGHHCSTQYRLGRGDRDSNCDLYLQWQHNY